MLRSKTVHLFLSVLVITMTISLIEISCTQAMDQQPARLQSANILAASATPTISTTPAPAKVLHNADWKPVEKDFNGVPMMQVPAGCFTMGSTSEEIAALIKQYKMDDFKAEDPQTQICFDAPFWIDETEVTNAQFKQFNGKAANPSDRKDDLLRPNVNITWFEARDFCVVRGARLPSEAEWEYATRGPDGLTYPWGNTFSDDKTVDGNNSKNQTANVGSKPSGASWVGALDLSGNVFEWTSSIYKPYPYVATDGRESNDEANSRRLLRGGSFYYHDAFALRGASRGNGPPDIWYSDIGFRCVVS